VIHVAIHPSQFPERVRADLIDSLRRREIRHKFHYESCKQAQKWLAVHEAHSPARTDSNTRQIYQDAFKSVAEGLPGIDVQVIGLGCGGGQKDVALLQELSGVDCRSIYTAVDVSLPLVITARERAKAHATQTRGLVCDLEIADDIVDELSERSVSQRLVTFFGMIPNGEPDVILPRLARLLNRGDRLLLSANLAPGGNYRTGVESVLSQYDNALTGDWLFTFLSDLGVERSDGEVKFGIEEVKGLLRIRADFQFSNARTIRLDDETFAFKPGESVRLFYSYRYTPDRLSAELARHGWSISKQWISPSGEEGVFLI
jgi:L-histidine N-alpha-methyltransferase